MKALIFTEFGPPSVLRLEDMPRPLPAPDQALVRVYAAGLNFADVYRRQGRYHLAGGAPWILGYEAAGIITEVGGQVSQFKVGDRVGFADSPHANAEYAVVAKDKLVALPDAITFDEAAGVLLQGLTAQYLISDSYPVKPGQTVIVQAAAGGVGLLLCQLLQDVGARVVALVSSEEKAQAVAELGVKEIYHYSDWISRIPLEVGEVDIIYDSLGSTLMQSLSLVRVGGAVVFYGMAGGIPELVDPRYLMDRSLTLTGGDLWNVLSSQSVRQDRANSLFQALLSGRLKLTIAAKYSLDKGPDAHALLEGRGVIGKVLLTIEE